MSFQLAQHGTRKAFTPEIRRGFQYLPNFGMRAVLTFDANRSNEQFGDKSNVAKGYVRLLSRDNRVLAISSFPIFNGPGAAVTSMQGAMAVDASGHLHIAYTYHNKPAQLNPVAQEQVVKYVKIVVSGETLEPGPHETVYAHNPDEAIASIDIDIPGSNSWCPLVVTAYTNWKLNKSYAIASNRKTAGGWNQSNFLTLDGLYHFPSVSVATSTDTGEGDYSLAISYTTVPVAADQGDFLFAGKAQVGGNFLGGPFRWQAGLNKYQNDGWREFSAFYVGNSTFLFTGTVNSIPYKPFFAAVKVRGANDFLSVMKPIVRSDASGAFAKYTNANFSSWNVIRNGTSGTVISYHFDNAFAYANMFDYRFDTVDHMVLTPKPSQVIINQDANKFSAAYPVTLMAGDHGRFATSKSMGCVLFYGEPAFKYIVTELDLPGKCVNVRPSQGEYVTNSQPVLQAKPAGATTDNVVGQIEFQLALDSNFASGLTTAVSSISWITGQGVISAPTSEAALMQQTYYMRSRIRDLLGNVSDWSDVTSFTVKHPPSAQNMSPRNNGFLSYAATKGNSSLIWQFVDPDPRDFQTAYSVELTDATTGELIGSTDKVISGSQRVDIPTPVEHTEKMLSWRLTVWDRHDVQSVDIPACQFYLARLPELQLVFPTNNLIRSANPTIQWVTTPYGGRTQQAYRVWITRNVDNRIIFDSLIKSGTAQSQVIPPNIIRNKNNYVLHLMVQDTNGLQSTLDYPFYTDWELPYLCPPPIVDIQTYEALGYAYITAPIPDLTDYANKDFVTEYNVFRRTYESGNEEWVKVISAPAGGKKFLTFKDYMLPAGIPSEYVMTMTVDIYGEVQVGNPEHAKPVIVNPGQSNYWLIDTQDNKQSMMLPQVTDDGWTDEYEQTDFHISGRGRIVEIDDRIGNTGSLTAKFRDRQLGLPGKPVTNSVSNSRLVSDGTGVSLKSWTLKPESASDVIQVAEMVSYSPCNTQRDGMLNVTVTDNAGVGAGELIQDVFRFKKGTTEYLSVWVEGSESINGEYFSVRAEAWDTEDDYGNVISEAEKGIQFNVNESGDSIGYVDGSPASADFKALDPHYNWYRLDIPIFLPAHTAKIKIKLKITNLRSQKVSKINLGGVQFAEYLTRYFDGYSNFAEWVGEPELDPSYSPGFYTARKMRQNIEALKSRRTKTYLRTPFGDIYSVQIGNIGISRIPGVGSNEFVDVTIPYLEVADE